MLNPHNRIKMLNQLDRSIDVPDAFPEHARKMLDALENINQCMRRSEALIKEAETQFLEAMLVYDSYICLLEQNGSSNNSTS